MFNSDDNEQTLNATLNALNGLDVLDQNIDKLIQTNKIGDVAGDNIKDYSDDIRDALESVEFQFCMTLLFEFGPHGTGSRGTCGSLG